MPNFDGKGPLKRGRVIGRGRGACTNNNQEYGDTSHNAEPESRDSRKAD